MAQIPLVAAAARDGGDNESGQDWEFGWESPWTTPARGVVAPSIRARLRGAEARRGMLPAKGVLFDSVASAVEIHDVALGLDPAAYAAPLPQGIPRDELRRDVQTLEPGARPRSLPAMWPSARGAHRND